MSSRNVLVLTLLLGYVPVLGACDLILKAGHGERFVDPHLSCAGNSCTCTGGFDDCDGDADNGCETDITQDPNCGACGATCENGACSNGTCVCAPGFADCDDNGSNGCEAQPASDPHNCGACGTDCADGVCQDGVCQVAG